MFEDRTKADVVDRAIDRPEAPGSDEGRFARELTVLVRGFALEPHRAAALWERIITPAPAPTVKRSGFTWSFGRSRGRVLTAAFAVLAASLVVAAALVSFGRSVDARELVARVELGSVDPSAVGLTRYSGSLRFSSWMTADGTRGNVPVVIDQRIFFEAPNRMRLESAPAQTSSAPVSIVVGDGTGVWLLTPSTRTAFRMDSVPGGTLASLAASDVQAVLANASRDYAVRAEGNDIVAGRAADRVDLTPKSTSSFAGRVGKTILSIDHQYSVVLAGRVVDPSGQLLYEWAFSSIDFAPSFDASLFALPAGTTVVSVVDRTPPAAVGTDARWSELARALPFAIFRPTFRSETLEPGYPSQDQNRLVVAYRSATNLGAAIVIEAASAVGPEPGEVVALPSGPALYARDNDRHRVVVRRDGTRIEVQASLDLSRDDLTKIAASLVAVPR
jgi:outer membrane lipoprotein-sorting protein